MGVPQKPLPTEEDLQSMSEEQYQTFVFDYYRGAYKKAGLKPSFKQKMKYQFSTTMSWIYGILILAVVYLFLNGILVGGQYLWHIGDRHRLSELEELMNSEQVTISQYEDRINNGGLSDEEYSDYKLLIYQYNIQADQYNVISEKIGDMWFLIPGFHSR
ncbi:hypothetical protein D1872_227170 [compost metagenome]